MKIGVACAQDQDRFLKPLLKYWAKNRKYQVKRFRQGKIADVLDMMDWSDVTWFEWCSDVVMEISNFPRLCRNIVRLHGVEAYNKIIDNVRWERIDDLVLVAPHMKRILAERQPNVKQTKVHIIPNGIDMKRFKIPRETFNRDHITIGSLGFINHNKNQAFLFQLMKYLTDHTDKKYKLHIAGVHQSDELKDYLSHMEKALGIDVTYWGWVKKSEEFLKGIDILVSTSMRESFGMGIMEAMAMGVKPVVHSFVGAEGFYPDWAIFNTIDEFVALCNAPAEPQKYRDWVEKYSLKKQIEKTDALLGVV